MLASGILFMCPNQLNFWTLCSVAYPPSQFSWRRRRGRRRTTMTATSIIIILVCVIYSIKVKLTLSTPW